jgi:phage protein U
MSLKDDRMEESILHRVFHLPGKLVSRGALLAFPLILGLALPPAQGQQFQSKDQEPAEVKNKDTGKAPAAKEAEKTKEKLAKAQPGPVKLSPPEVLAETVIFAFGGRPALQAARASSSEQGTIRIATEQGDISGTFTLRRLQKEKSWQDLFRTDLEIDTPESAQRAGNPAKVKFTMTFNGASVWGAQNDQYMSPAADSELAFRSQLVHDYTTLLRYKEDGSKIELIGPETVVGIDTQVLDVTLPTGEKTRFWISAKTYRILHLEYQMKLANGSTPRVRVSYYPPYKVVQNTLVPGRRVMEQDGKFVQEINLSQISYSAKLDPDIFVHLP